MNAFGFALNGERRAEQPRLGPAEIPAQWRKPRRLWWGFRFLESVSIQSKMGFDAWSRVLRRSRCFGGSDFVEDVLGAEETPAVLL